MSRSCSSHWSIEPLAPADSTVILPDEMRAFLYTLVETLPEDALEALYHVVRVWLTMPPTP